MKTKEISYGKEYQKDLLYFIGEYLYEAKVIGNNSYIKPYSKTYLTKRGLVVEIVHQNFSDLVKIIEKDDEVRKIPVHKWLE